MEILSLDTATTQVEVAPEGLDPERPRDVNGGFLSHGTPKSSHIDHDLMGINGDLMVV